MNQDQSIDLSQLDGTNEATFNVPVAFNPETGDAIAGFMVVGRDSARYQDAKRQQDLTSVKKAVLRGGKPVDAKTDEGAGQFLNDGAAREQAIVSACVVSWYGFTNGGVPTPLTLEALSKVFKARPTWFRKVADAIETDANFLQPSSKTSAPSLPASLT